MMTMMVMVRMMKSILDLSVAVIRGRISWKWGHSAVMDRMFLCKLGSEQSQKTLRESVHLSYTVWNNGGWKEKGFGTDPIYGPELCSEDWFRVLFTNFLETTVILCDVREAQLRSLKKYIPILSVVQIPPNKGLCYTLFIKIGAFRMK